MAQKNYETANSMLEAGWNIDVSWCFSPLIMAIHDADLDAIKWLISKGADVNYPDSCGIKPLTRCVLKKSYAAAELLLQHGANPNSQDGQFCSTAFMSAVEEGLTDIIKLLFSHGLKINKSPELYGLAAAAKQRNTELCEILLDFGFPVEIKEIPARGSHAYAKINYSPLGYAAIHNDIETCRLLLKRGANPDFLPEGSTFSPVAYAVDKGNYESSMLLLQNGSGTRNRKQIIDLTDRPMVFRKESSNSLFKEIINIHSLVLDAGEQLGFWVKFARDKNFEMLEFMLNKEFTLDDDTRKRFDEITTGSTPDFFSLEVSNYARSLLGLNAL